MRIRLVPGSRRLPKDSLLILTSFEDEPHALDLESVPVGEGASLGTAAENVRRAQEAEGFTAAKESFSLFHHAEDGGLYSILVQGLGKAGECSPEALRDAFGAVSRRLAAGYRGQRSVRLVISVAREPWAAATRGPVELRPEFALGHAPPCAPYTLADLLQAIGEGWILGSYGYFEFKTEQKPKALPTLEVQLIDGAVNGRDLNEALQRAEVVADAVALARDLVNMPASALNPAALAKHARELARKTGLRCQVLDENALRKEKMGAILGVGQGSDAASRLIVLEHRPAEAANRTKPLVLVGKAITFDSGGLSIKPSKGMQDMKMDMAGGAAVIAAMGAIARLNVPVPVVGVIPSAENMISGSATRPGDVVRTRAGLTIEVVNTDAEGRLILADALDFARKFRPSLLVDVATLTGACVVALGESIIGLLSNDPAAAERVRAAAASSGEAVWELPLYREFFERIQCDAADMKNSGGRSAGASTAAALLARFVEGVPWCHLDIAGPAWCEKEIGYRGRGATGAAVRLLIELARHEPPA